MFGRNRLLKCGLYKSLWLLGLIVFFCVSLSSAETPKDENTIDKNSKVPSVSAQTGEKLKDSPESVQSKGKLEASSASVQSVEKLKASPESVQSKGKLEAPLASVQSVEKLKASPESVQSKGKLEAPLASVQSVEKLKASPESVQSEEKIEASSTSTHSVGNLLKTYSEEVSENSFLNKNYGFYVATSLLRRTGNKRARFFGETFTLGISRKNWKHKDIYINFRPLIETDRKVTHVEFLTRLFYSLSFSDLKTYTGVGMGFGFSPYHIYSKNRNIDRILSLNFQLFTGFRWSNLCKNFGFFGELNLTGLFLPFFVVFGGGPRIVSSTKVAPADYIEIGNIPKSSSLGNKPKGYVDTLLNVGILYNF